MLFKLLVRLFNRKSSMEDRGFFHNQQNQIYAYVEISTDKKLSIFGKAGNKSFFNAEIENFSEGVPKQIVVYDYEKLDISEKIWTIERDLGLLVLTNDKGRIPLTKSSQRSIKFSATFLTYDINLFKLFSFRNGSNLPFYRLNIPTLKHILDPFKKLGFKCQINSKRYSYPAVTNDVLGITDLFRLYSIHSKNVDFLAIMAKKIHTGKIDPNVRMHFGLMFDWSRYKSAKDKNTVFRKAFVLALENIDLYLRRTFRGNYKYYKELYYSWTFLHELGHCMNLVHLSEWKNGVIVQEDYGSLMNNMFNLISIGHRDYLREFDWTFNKKEENWLKTALSNQILPSDIDFKGHMLPRYYKAFKKNNQNQNQKTVSLQMSKNEFKVSEPIVLEVRVAEPIAAELMIDGRAEHKTREINSNLEHDTYHHPKVFIRSLSKDRFAEFYPTVQMFELPNEEYERQEFFSSYCLTFDARSNHFDSAGEYEIFASIGADEFEIYSDLTTIRIEEMTEKQDGIEEFLTSIEVGVMLTMGTNIDHDFIDRKLNEYSPTYVSELQEVILSNSKISIRNFDKSNYNSVLRIVESFKRVFDSIGNMSKFSKDVATELGRETLSLMNKVDSNEFVNFMKRSSVQARVDIDFQYNRIQFWDDGQYEINDAQKELLDILQVRD